MKKALKFHWMLPKGGEMTSEETARVITTSKNSFAGKPDMKNWIPFLKQAEDSGIDSVLLSFGNYEPDTLMVACALGLETSKIKFIVAYRLGLMQPTLFVQQVNTLSNLIGGRFSLNIIAGNSQSEQHGYGDFLDHDQRYDRADEFLEVCHSFWRNDNNITFEGKYCRLIGGKLHTPFISQERNIPEIFVSGHSEGAEKLTQNQGNCWLRLIDTPEKLKPIISSIQESGKEVCLRLSIICRSTKEEAIEAAEALKENPQTVKKVRHFLKSSNSKNLNDALAMADQGEWLNSYLWTGLVPSFGAAVIAMVGTPQELADAFLAYKRIGVSQFIISGWPKLEEMSIFGRDVLPLIRKAELEEQSKINFTSSVTEQSITPKLNSIKKN
jgi:alkanesulfonate monooxygenase